jgi:hypothetical protein
MAEMPMVVTAVAPMAVTLATKQSAEAKKQVNPKRTFFFCCQITKLLS